MNHLDRGGFPGIFAIRDEAARDELLRGWVSVTLERDLQLFKKVKFDSELASRILYQVAQLPEPTAALISRSLKKDTRMIQKYLDAFTTLFVLHRLNPSQGSTGKPRYYVCDVALVGLLGGAFERKLETWVFHELLARMSYLGRADLDITFYRNTKGSTLQWILQDKKNPKNLTAVRLVSTERFDLRDTELLKSFYSKMASQGIKPRLILLAPHEMALGIPDVEVLPWESAAG